MKQTKIKLNLSFLTWAQFAAMITHKPTQNLLLWVIWDKLEGMLI
jgi:hypothetical protein